MNISSIIKLTILGLFLGSTLSQAQVSEEQEHQELRKLKAIYEEAVSTDQLSKLKPYLADGFTGVMITGEEVKSFQELTAYHDHIKTLIGEGGSYRVKVNTDQTIFHGNVSISRGITDEEVKTAQGKLYQFHAPWSAICLKVEGQWKIFRVQSTMDPINNVFVKADVNLVKWFYGLGGMILGGVLGFVLLRLKKKS